MADQSNHEEQLAEIHEIIAETRSGFTGGGLIALVWGVLSAAAYAIIALAVVQNYWVVWGTHSALGWATTLVWFRRESRVEGRISLRGVSVLRLWASITLAVWLCIWALCAGAQGLSALLPILLGLGVVATGLISESVFSQCVGVGLMVAGTATAVFAPRSLTDLLTMAVVVLAGLIWGAGSWLVKERK